MTHFNEINSNLWCPNVMWKGVAWRNGNSRPLSLTCRKLLACLVFIKKEAVSCWHAKILSKCWVDTPPLPTRSVFYFLMGMWGCGLDSILLDAVIGYTLVNCFPKNGVGVTISPWSSKMLSRFLITAALTYPFFISFSRCPEIEMGKHLVFLTAESSRFHWLATD